MIKFLSKPYRWAIIYTVILALAMTFTLLDTFVFPKSIADADTPAFSNSNPPETTPKPSEVIITDTSYEDENIKINIETYRKHATMIYAADIQISDPTYLKTAFANNIFGRNITKTTSGIAKSKNAVFAVNGDFYGFRDKGYVLRNGVAYRDTPWKKGNQALVIDKNGNLFVVTEGEISMSSLVDMGAWQVFSFGPALVVDGEIAVNRTSEVEKAMSSNPRTAIGQISRLHYMVIVSDGRTDESAGLSLYQLAQEFKDRGCSVAYNLDGGGSSTMYFNGKVINKPINGGKIKERKVSDIVYIGY